MKKYLIDNNIELIISELNEKTIAIEILRQSDNDNLVNLMRIFNEFEIMINEYIDSNNNVEQIMTTYASYHTRYDAKRWFRLCYDILSRKKPAGWQVIATSNMIVLRKV